MIKVYLKINFRQNITESSEFHFGFSYLMLVLIIKPYKIEGYNNMNVSLFASWCWWPFLFNLLRKIVGLHDGLHGIKEA